MAEYRITVVIDCLSEPQAPVKHSCKWCCPWLDKSRALGLCRRIEQVTREVTQGKQVSLPFCEVEGVHHEAT